MNSGVLQIRLQVWRRGARVAYETRPTRRARLREEVQDEGHSFRVRVSVAQTLDDACVDGTFSARRAETPDAWRRFAVGLEDLCRCVQKRKVVATTNQRSHKVLEKKTETVSCLPPAAARRARTPRESAHRRTAQKALTAPTQTRRAPCLPPPPPSRSAPRRR